MLKEIIKNEDIFGYVIMAEDFLVNFELSDYLSIFRFYSIYK